MRRHPIARSPRSVISAAGIVSLTVIIIVGSGYNRSFDWAIDLQVLRGMDQAESNLLEDRNIDWGQDFPAQIKWQTEHSEAFP
tara:strand:+ start:142 stop:390 length:249 start_codon:yes stop_codon:yes gene_type:complete